MAQYDATAALEVLGAYAEQRNPSASIEAREAAAKELLNEVAALGKGRMLDLAAGPLPGYARATVAIGFSFSTVNVIRTGRPGALRSG